MTSEIDGFLLQNGYLFRFRKLCILCTFLRDYLVCELHVRALLVILAKKTIEVVDNLFYWLSLRKMLQS